MFHRMLLHTASTVFFVLVYLTLPTSGSNNTDSSHGYFQDKDIFCSGVDYLCSADGMNRCCKSTDTNCCYDAQDTCCAVGVKCEDGKCLEGCVQPEDYYCGEAGMNRCCTAGDPHCCYNSKKCCPGGQKCVNDQCQQDSCGPTSQPEDYYCAATDMNRCCTANDKNCCYDSKFCCPVGLKCVDGQTCQPECGPSSGPSGQPEDYYCNADGMQRCCTANDTNCCYASKVCCAKGVACIEGRENPCSSSQHYKSINSLIWILSLFAVVHYTKSKY